MKLYITIPKGELRESFLDEVAMGTLAEHFIIGSNDLERNLTEEELAVAAKGYDEIGKSVV